MNKIFSQASLQEKTLILNFLHECKKGAHFSFEKSNHNFFEEEYPDFYKSFLLGADNEVHLSAQLTKSVENMVVSLIMIRFGSGDAERYDDSYYSIFTCPAYPRGIKMEIPLSKIKSIVPIFHEKQ